MLKALLKYGVPFLEQLTLDDVTVVVKHRRWMFSVCMAQVK